MNDKNQSHELEVMPNNTVLPGGISQRRKIIVGAALAVGAAVAQAHAVDTPFDLSASTLILTGIAVIASTLVGAIIALSAGMDAWKKIRGFFNRAK